MAIHVRRWIGAGNARVTDMTNAGKRGKRCDIVCFSGWLPNSWEGEYRELHHAMAEVEHYLTTLPESTDFEIARAGLIGLLVNLRKNLPTLGTHLRTFDEQIRGIDAPVPELTAGVAEKWSAGADESGIHVNDLVDQMNLPCCITPHDQTHSQAYKLAAKVWHKLATCATFHDACDVLRAAGCKLHYYCRMD